MKKITQTLRSKLYTYDPKQYMPIYVDGQLENKREFILYKTRTLLLQSVKR